MADELSYYQDRVLAESTIETATQRLSVVRHARLVDYEPAPATVAAAILQLDVAGPPASSPRATGWTIDLREPLLIRALGADGSVVDFEIEDPAVGLAGAVSAAPPAWATVDTRWNPVNLPPYYWDDSQRCLPAGSTDFYVIGHHLGLYPGQQLLLDSPAADSGDPPVRELVTVSAIGGDGRPPDRLSSPHFPHAHLPPGRHDRRPRPEQHRRRREHRPGRPGRAPERDVHDPRSRHAVARSGGRPRRGELDAAGPAARLPLLRRIRPGGLARHDGPGRTRCLRGPRSSSARSRPTARTAPTAAHRGCSSTGCSGPGPPTKCLR